MSAPGVEFTLRGNFLIKAVGAEDNDVLKLQACVTADLGEHREPLSLCIRVRQRFLVFRSGESWKKKRGQFPCGQFAVNLLLRARIGAENPCSPG